MTELNATQIVIVDQHDVLKAWSWLLNRMTSRPSPNCQHYTYDEKRWLGANGSSPLHPTADVACKLAHLYLTSELGDAEMILNLTNYQLPCDVILYHGSLDPDVVAIVGSTSRFRNTLSEHLAFWTRLATEGQRRRGTRFACSAPNVQPEDKGPDGVFLAVSTASEVEIHSVKNSIGDPRGLISSKRFRSQGVPKPRKQLDDLWRCAHEGHGFVRLDRLLADVSRSLSVTADQSIRMSLLAKCGYNAVVVAEQSYATPNLFEGYQHVTTEVDRHIATYIGANGWAQVAEETRRAVSSILQKARDA